MADLAFRVQSVVKTEIGVTEAAHIQTGIDVIHASIAHFNVESFPGGQLRVEGPEDGHP